MESLVAWFRVTKKRSLRVVDLDADRNPALAQQLGVRTTPALLLLAHGEVVGRLEGRSTGRQIEALIGLHLEEESAVTAEDEPPASTPVGYGDAVQGDDASTSDHAA